MASYRLLIKPSAAKEMEALPKRDRASLVGRIAELASAPRPTGSEKLSGEEQYRIRQGVYRVLYAIADTNRSVIVVKIGHRKDVYR